MSNLHSTLSSVLTDRYITNAARVHELAALFTDAQFWQKPFPYGNSFGHLVLHLTGNLNYYIGAQIAKTGYVRDRPREFNDPTPPSKDEALKHFDDAISMVIATIRAVAGELVGRLLRHRRQCQESSRHDHAVRRPHPAPHRTDDLSCSRVAKTGLGPSQERIKINRPLVFAFFADFTSRPSRLKALIPPSNNTHSR